ncbi:MAG: hypothetical protein J6B77_10335, partial [Clostridia bacterium]|nr:hypothetical protein [Clostridia bacterium]
GADAIVFADGIRGTSFALFGTAFGVRIPLRAFGSHSAFCVSDLAYGDSPAHFPFLRKRATGTADTDIGIYASFLVMAWHGFPMRGRRFKRFYGSVRCYDTLQFRIGISARISRYALQRLRSRDENAGSGDVAKTLFLSLALPCLDDRGNGDQDRFTYDDMNIRYGLLRTVEKRGLNPWKKKTNFNGGPSEKSRKKFLRKKIVHQR